MSAIITSLRLGIAIGALSCCMLTRAACTAYAQPSDARTTLLRALVAEATWLERDHRAILHVLARRAERAGVTVDAMAQQYCSVFRVPIARRWVMELQPTCEQPAHWPASLDWEAHRMQCELTVERVDAFLAGDSIDPCRGRASHFGARDLEADVLRAERAAWRVVDCGETASEFYLERAKERAK